MALANTAAMFGVFVLARRLSGSFAGGLTALALAATYATYSVQTGRLYPDPLTAALLVWAGAAYASGALLPSRRRMAGAGVLLGLALLLRAQVLEYVVAVTPSRAPGQRPLVVAHAGRTRPRRLLPDRPLARPRGLGRHPLGGGHARRRRPHGPGHLPAELSLRVLAAARDGRLDRTLSLQAGPVLQGDGGGGARARPRPPPLAREAVRLHGALRGRAPARVAAARPGQRLPALRPARQRLQVGLPLSVRRPGRRATRDRRAGRGRRGAARGRAAGPGRRVPDPGRAGRPARPRLSLAALQRARDAVPDRIGGRVPRAGGAATRPGGGQGRGACSSPLPRRRRPRSSSPPWCAARCRRRPASDACSGSCSWWRFPSWWWRSRARRWRRAAAAAGLARWPSSSWPTPCATGGGTRRRRVSEARWRASSRSSASRPRPSAA